MLDTSVTRRSYTESWLFAKKSFSTSYDTPSIAIKKCLKSKNTFCYDYRNDASQGIQCTFMNMMPGVLPNVSWITHDFYAALWVKYITERLWNSSREIALSINEHFATYPNVFGSVGFSHHLSLKGIIPS